MCAPWSLCLWHQWILIWKPRSLQSRGDVGLFGWEIHLDNLLSTQRANSPEFNQPKKWMLQKPADQKFSFWSSRLNPKTKRTKLSLSRDLRDASRSGCPCCWGGGAGRTRNVRRGSKLFVVFNSNFDFIVSKSSNLFMSSRFVLQNFVKTESRQRLMNNIHLQRKTNSSEPHALDCNDQHMFWEDFVGHSVSKLHCQNLRVPKSTESISRGPGFRP